MFPAPGFPGSNPAANGPLCAIPDPLVFNVLKKATFFFAAHYVTLTIPGLRSTNLVREEINLLVMHGVNPPVILRHGMRVMVAHQMLGELQNLQNVSVMEL